MTKVTTIDHASLSKIIAPALKEKLAELSKELGIEITVGGGSYSQTTGTLKLKLATLSDEGIVVTPEREAFLEFHELYDLPKEALDAEIELSGQKLRIAGIKTNAPKNNVILACLDGSGRNRVAAAATVKAAYNMQHVHARKAG